MFDPYGMVKGDVRTMSNKKYIKNLNNVIFTNHFDPNKLLDSVSTLIQLNGVLSVGKSHTSFNITFFLLGPELLEPPNNIKLGKI